jgi:hypothetical protein
MSSPPIDGIIERMCLVKLTEAEALQRGDSMAEQELKIEILKSERARLNAQIKEHVTARAQLAHTIESKTESRPVECQWVMHRPTGTMILTRLDTKQEIERRAITVADRQTELPIAADDDADDAADTPRRRRAAVAKKRGRTKKAG